MINQNSHLLPEYQRGMEVKLAELRIDPEYADILVKQAVNWARLAKGVTAIGAPGVAYGIGSETSGTLNPITNIAAGTKTMAEGLGQGVKAVGNAYNSYRQLGDAPVSGALKGWQGLKDSYNRGMGVGAGTTGGARMVGLRQQIEKSPGYNPEGKHKGAVGPDMGINSLSAADKMKTGKPNIPGYSNGTEQLGWHTSY